MSPEATQLFEAILALSPNDQRELIDSLLTTHEARSTLPFDPEWLEVARRRSAEIASGAVTPASWPVVRKRVRERLEGRSRG